MVSCKTTEVVETVDDVEYENTEYIFIENELIEVNYE
jgi:hypothetical protein